jgi:polysaccharide export outer membrane protein
MIRCQTPPALSARPAAPRGGMARAFALLLGLAAATACAPAAPPLATLPASPLLPAADPNAPGAGPGYVLSAGDEISVFVYRAPELSVSLPIRPDGRVSIPLAPDVQAAGRTPTQLADSIRDRLKAFVVEPNVTVMIRNSAGQADRQIRVIGEVAAPAVLPYREGMRVSDAIIGARGLTRFAAGNRAEIIRREPGGPATPQPIRVRLSDLLRDGDVSQDLPLRPGDTLVVPQGWF